jgi:outer membrane protein TolC
MRLLLVALVLLPRLAGAAPVKLTLDQVIAKAMANPRVEMAQQDARAAAARADEADDLRLPRIEGTAFGTLSPDIECLDPGCTMTTPRNFAFRFSGLYGSAELKVTQPLYTFGKISHARSAAQAGLAAQHALADEAAGDVAVQAAQAYWGVKLARELGYMLDDGIDEIQKAQQKFGERGHEISVMDKQRVEVLLAEAKVKRADATQGESQAIAGLGAVTGVAGADVDEDEFAPVDYTLPTADALAAAAAAHRPQSIAAREGAKAGDQLAAVEHAAYFPDVAVVGDAVISDAQGVEDPPGAFAYDPYRRTGAGVVLGLKWTLEPWNIADRVARARADAHKMHAQADLAKLGARYDALVALSQARAAHDKVAAAEAGEKAARAWVAAVLQNEAIGTAEPKDLVDAYLAYFQLRSEWAQAVFDWNVAVVRLRRSTGEYRAGGARPR